MPASQKEFLLFSWPRAKQKTRPRKFNQNPSRRPKNRSLRDLGTPELRKKRALILGSNQSQSLSLSSLDVLYAHEKISSSQYQAGQRYSALSRLAQITIGAPHLHKGLQSLSAGQKSQKHKAYGITLDGFSEEKCQAIEQRWKTCQDALIKESARVFTLIQKAIVFEENCVDTLLSDRLSLAIIQRGLSILEKIFKQI